MSVVAIRMTVFAALFASLFALERLFPRRPVRREGYVANLGIFFLDGVLTRLLLAVGGVAAATYAQSKGWGLFNALDTPAWVSGVVAFLALDFAVWAQHVVMHKVPMLWRLHEIHHADEDFDVTTGLRFHPVEIALSLLFKSVVILLLGAPVVAVIVFEIVLNGGAMFSHSNLRLSPKLDRWLRLLTVTPDMHRVHHSTDRAEANSNYGFFLPWWDRLFRTYRAQPVDGHMGMAIGVAGFRGGPRLRKLLARPFARRAPATPAR